MTDELATYKSDRAAWVAYAAPRWLPMLEKADDERVLFLWRAARPELKRAVWALATEALKARIRKITQANPSNEQ